MGEVDAPGILRLCRAEGLGGNYRIELPAGKFHVVGLPASKWLCHPGYTSIHRVIASRSGHRNVVSMNETAHLRGTGLEIGPHTAPEAQA